MSVFRFAVMGAGDISRKFCDAVRRIEGAEVRAIASRSIERARDFANKNGVAEAYGSYREMLERVKPDCVYIGAYTSMHHELTMLCLECNTPVLCEKAMFRSSAEAEEALSIAHEKGVFVMEAMWSYFLPAVKKVKEWIDEGRIGQIRFSDALIGFKAPSGERNRYHNAERGGGVAYDLTVYTYDLTTLMLGHDWLECNEEVLWEDTGVDLVNHITLRYPNTLSSMTTSIIGRLEERMIFYGDCGKIVLPSSHFASEAFLYDENWQLVEHFKDIGTVNGFVYEAREAMECVCAGKLESDVVTHAVTLDSARLYDRINKTWNHR